MVVDNREVAKRALEIIDSLPSFCDSERDRINGIRESHSKALAAARKLTEARRKVFEEMLLSSDGNCIDKRQASELIQGLIDDIQQERESLYDGVFVLCDKYAETLDFLLFGLFLTQGKSAEEFDAMLEKSEKERPA